MFDIPYDLTNLVGGYNGEEIPHYCYANRKHHVDEAYASGGGRMAATKILSCWMHSPRRIYDVAAGLPRLVEAAQSIVWRTLQAV